MYITYIIRVIDAKAFNITSTISQQLFLSNYSYPVSVYLLTRQYTDAALKCSNTMLNPEKKRYYSYIVAAKDSNVSCQLWSLLNYDPSLFS